MYRPGDSLVEFRALAQVLREKRGRFSEQNAAGSGNKKVRKASEDTGVSSLEAALIVPVFLVIVILVVQLSLAVWQNRSVQLAAEEAADAASRLEAEGGDGDQAAQQVLDELGVDGAQVSVVRGDGSVEVTITAPVFRLIPMDLTTTATGIAPIEEFVPLEERN